MIQRIDLKSYPSSFQSAVSYLTTNQYPQAQQQFLKCLIYNPTSYSSYLNLAYIKHYHQEYQDVRKICDVAINLKPYFGQAYFNRCLATIAQSTINYKQASTDISSALSCAYLQKYKKQFTIQHLKKSLQHSQNNIQTLRYLHLLSQPPQQSYYQSLLNKYQNFCQISGPICYQKISVSHGLFRLCGTNALYSHEQISQKIQQFLTLNDNYITPINNKQLQQSCDIDIQQCNIQIQQPYQIKTPSIPPQILNNSQYIPQTQSFSQNISIIQTQQIQQQSNDQFPILKDLSNTLNIPQQQKIKTYNQQKYHNHQLHQKISQSRLSNTSSCSSTFHNSRCSKCKRQCYNSSLIPPDSIKMSIKTLQIYRNENVPNPKPYLTISDGTTTYTTDIDYTGGFYPKWNKIFYLHKNTNNAYHIQLYHHKNKQNQSYFIGKTKFHVKKRRIKTYFYSDNGDGLKKTGYVFLQFYQ